MIGNEFYDEIKAAFNLETVDTELQEPSNIKPLFKEHKERVVPATHLQTERFLDKWRKKFIDHGLEVMRLIVEEEKLQLETLQTQIAESSNKLEPLKEKPDFDKLNDLLKKEIDRTQKNLKFTKQSKFKRDLDDWARVRSSTLLLEAAGVDLGNADFPHNKARVGVPNPLKVRTSHTTR